MAKKQTKELRFGLFVEGAHSFGPRGESDLTNLWRELCGHFSVTADRLDVHGITKAQILAMDPQTPLQFTSRQPLDAMVAIQHEKKNFDILIVAFDALPENQNIVPGGCLRTEVDFVLEHFASSIVLPASFRAEAKGLIKNHKVAAIPRGPGRPPRGSFDTLFMDPKFEALILTDASAWLKVFGLKKAPKEWPAMGTTDEQLEQRFAKVVKFGRDRGTTPHYMHGDTITAKHAWAREAVKKAGTKSRLWSHPIAQRLAEILA